MGLDELSRMRKMAAENAGSDSMLAWLIRNPTTSGRLAQTVARGVIRAK
jgi:hypothetical protein